MIDLKEVQKLIASDGARQSRLAVQAAYVKGTNPSILAPAPKEEPDNRVPVPIARRIVMFYLGYMGKEGNIVYSGDGFDDALKETFDTNNEGLKTHQLLANVLSFGNAFELHYAQNGKDRFSVIPITQCIPIYDDAIEPNMIGFIRHWSKRDYDGKATFYANVYDSSEMIKYEGPTVESLAEVSRETYGYGRVPVVEFYGNAEKGNIFDHVTAIFDSIDKILSENYVNELSKLSDAILALAGKIDDTPDEYGVSDVDRIRTSGLMQNVGDGSKAVSDFVAYITKNINPAFLESGYDRLYDLAYEMAPLPNPKETQNGEASGVAHQFRILAFEYACATIASYFSIGLQDRISLIKGLGNNLSAGEAQANTDVTITWNRNLPNDLLTLSQIFANLGGEKLSLETLLKLFPTTVIEDPAEELQRIEKEKQEAVDLFQEQNPEGVNNAQPGA